ncbi:MAG TPA: tetratricopeptide repeat protein [Bacteroidetes bacterium]|nr:tetratricopeptide repeat protein [Bacteroidota bacterium]
MKKNKGLLPFFVYALTAVLLIGCGPKRVEKESVLDTPDNHFTMGMRLLDDNRIDDARAEFQRALDLDPDYPEAYAGMALAAAMSKDFKQAHSLVNKALKKNKKSFESRVIRGRIFTLERKGKKNEWVKKAAKEFGLASRIDPGSPKPYYYLGLTYKAAYDFMKAANAFSKVVSMKGDYAKEANDQWEMMQKIQRAAPGTKIGMKIALIDEIDRADLAVLLIEEMKLREVFEKRRKKNYDTSFKTPDDPLRFQADWVEKAKAMTDVDSHWAKNWIYEIVRIGGMEPFPDHTFRPDQTITRANYAQVMQKILVLATADESLARKYIGEPSRFPDVNSSHYAYNAMALMVDRGILKAETISGEFRPAGTMTGADALLAIRQFQNALRLEFR